MEPWHELVIRGSEDGVRGFVVGFVAGRGTREQPVFGRDVGLASDSLGERLRALFTDGSHHVCFGPAALATALVEALATHGSEARLTLERSRVVRTAAFHFAARTHSADVAATLRHTFRDALPPGVRVERFVEEEKTDPAAQGVELYAPAHPYAYTCQGDVAGEVPGALDVRRRAAELDAVECGPLRLEG